MIQTRRERERVSVRESECERVRRRERERGEKERILVNLNDVGKSKYSSCFFGSKLRVTFRIISFLSGATDRLGISLSRKKNLIPTERQLKIIRALRI